MKCKILLTFFSFSFLLFSYLFLSSFLSPVSVSATSVTCFENNDFYGSQTSANLYISPSNPNNVSTICEVSSLDSSKNWYYYLKVTTGDDSTNSNFGNLFYLVQSTAASNISNFQRTNLITMSSADSYPQQNQTFEGIATDYYLRTSKHFGALMGNSAQPWYYVHVDFLVVSDSPSDLLGGSSPSGSLEITENGTYDVTNYAEAVVNVPESECPECSGGNYHNDLIKINNSILICGAIALVLYFFYCIYRMIIGGVGGAK